MVGHIKVTPDVCGGKPHITGHRITVIVGWDDVLDHDFILSNHASVIAPSLAMDTWDAVKDGTHNSNTDSYYTSDITRDWPWIMGMVGPTEIRMAKVNLPSLEALAKTK
jgi:hypothetical protein